LHVQIRDEAPDPIDPVDFLGVDLGIVNLAVDSENEAFSGETINRNRRRRTTARKQYQRRRTKRAKRKLKQMSGRQARFQNEISKKIVAKAKALGVGIALEDLSSIRGRVEPTAGRAFRRRFGNWSFLQLRTFIIYKAQGAGVPVVLVDPKYTSQTCAECGHQE